MDLNEQLRKAIEASGLRTQRIAEGTGLPPATISRFRRGLFGMTMETASKVADFLGLALAPAGARPRCWH